MYMKTDEFTGKNREEAFTEEEKQIIIQELNDDRLEFDIIIENKDIKILSNSQGFFDIFKSKYKNISLILTMIWILNSVVGYGPFFILSITLTNLGIKENDVETEVDIIKSQLFVSLIGLVSNPLGGFLCELKILGRVRTGSLSAFIGFIICIILVFDFSNVVTYLGLLNIFNTLTFNTAITYTSEVYHTYMRDYSSGLMNCLGSFGATISQSLYILYSNIGLKVPYIFTSIFFLITSLLFILLPIETRGNELDHDIEEGKFKENNPVENNKLD